MDAGSEPITIRLVYGDLGQGNPHLGEIRDGREHFATPPEKHLTMKVGKEGAVLQTRRGSTLCKLAPRFYQAIQEHIHEDPELFKEEDAQAFSFLLSWIDDTLVLDADGSLTLPMETVIKAFVLAECYDFYAFFQSHMVHFVREFFRIGHERNVKIASPDLVRFVHDFTRAESPIRRILVDETIQFPFLSPNVRWSSSCGETERWDCRELKDMREFDIDQADATFGASCQVRNLSVTPRESHAQARMDGAIWNPLDWSEEELAARYSYAVAPAETWTGDAAVREGPSDEGGSEKPAHQ